MGEHESSWAEYEKLVMDKLETFEKKLDEIFEVVVQLRIEQATQKTRVSIISGAIAVAASFIMQFILKGHSK